MKQLVDNELAEIGKTRLWKGPVAQSRSDRWAQAWVEEIKGVLNQALKRLRVEQDLEGKRP